MIRSVHAQFLRFASIGAIATAVHYALLITLVRSGAATPPIATTVGFSLGALVNYLLNYRYTFESDKPHLDALPKFITTALCGAALNYLVVRAGIALGQHYLIAQLGATALVLLWNFWVNRLWTFRATSSRRSLQSPDR